MSSLILKPGREKILLRRHPWIFSGAVARLDGDPASGATVDLLAANGQFLARAAYSPSSQIRARVWTFDPSEPVDADFFRKRIEPCAYLRGSPGKNHMPRMLSASSMPNPTVSPVSSWTVTPICWSCSP